MSFIIIKNKPKQKDILLSFMLVFFLHPCHYLHPGPILADVAGTRTVTLSRGK